MDPNPILRASFWSVFIGMAVNWMSYFGCSPGTVQRFMAIPTMQGAKYALGLFCICTIITKAIMCFSGLIIFAKYYDCDPLTSGRISKPDQILPYYVLDVAKKFPGLSGLFVAGIFSTAFSTLSTFLNTLSGIVYTDFIAPFLPTNTSGNKASNIMKTIVVVFGVICIGLVFIVDKVGAAVLELQVKISGITLGPLLGLFTLGMLFPIANEKGSIFGCLAAFAILSFIMIKAQLYSSNNTSKHFPKPLYTYGCNDSNFTTITDEILFSTTPVSITNVQEEPMWLFKISFYYYTLLGMILTIIISLPISWFTRSGKPVDANLFSPLIHRFLHKPDTKYRSIEKGLEMVVEKDDYHI